MAIYHLEAKVVSRGAGRSAVAASAYSYIAITNVVIVGMKIFFQEICFTNIHRIYQLSFFVEQAEFVV